MENTGSVSVSDERGEGHSDFEYGSKWYEIDLSTLKLLPSSISVWPQEMSSKKSRMREECLETIVALNLGILYPEERLLLVSTQRHLCSEADIYDYRWNIRQSLFGCEISLAH